MRTIADAVLYEGYLLYPYRASSAKNRSRWQFGVLGPPEGRAAAFGEAPDMAMQCLLDPGAAGRVQIHLRFLQLQVREVQRLEAGRLLYADVGELTVAGVPVLSWDEAVEREIALPELPWTPRPTFPVEVAGGSDVEPIADAGRDAGGPDRAPPVAADRAAADPDREPTTAASG